MRADVLECFNHPDYTGLAGTAGITGLNGRTRYGSIRTIYTAVAFSGLQQFAASFAIIIILTGVCRHDFGLFMAAAGTSDFRRKNNIMNFLIVSFYFFHNAYPVIRTKMNNKGNRIKSSLLTKAESPATPKSNTRTGVKQQSAVTTVPRIPNFSRRDMKNCEPPKNWTCQNLLLTRSRP